MYHVSQPVFGNGGGAVAHSPYHNQSSAFQNPPRVINDAKDFFVGAENHNAKKIYKLVSDRIENHKFIKGFASSSSRQVFHEELWGLEMTASELDSQQSHAIQYLQSEREAAQARVASMDAQIQYYQEAKRMLANFGPNLKERSKQVCDVVDGKKAEYLDELLIDVILETVNLESDPVDSIRTALTVRNSDDIRAMDKNLKYHLLTALSVKKYSRNPGFKQNIDEYKRSGVIDAKFLDSQIYGSTHDNDATLEGLLLVYLGLVPPGHLGFKRQSNRDESPWSTTVFSSTPDIAGGPSISMTNSGFRVNVAPASVSSNTVQSESFGAQGGMASNFATPKPATPKFGFTNSFSNEAAELKKLTPEDITMYDSDL